MVRAKGRGTRPERHGGVKQRDRAGGDRGAFPAAATAMPLQPACAGTWESGSSGQVGLCLVEPRALSALGAWDVNRKA